MAGRFIAVVVLVLSLYVTAGSSRSTDDAQNLVSCLDKAAQLSDSPTVDQLESALKYCENVLHGYSTHKRVPLSKEIKSLRDAANLHSRDKVSNKARKYFYDFLERVINDLLDEETKNKLPYIMDKKGRAYILYQMISQRTMIKDRFIMRTSTTGSPYNRVTNLATKKPKVTKKSKATKKPANWAKYGNRMIVADDAAEFGPDKTVYESPGKVVGAVGNTASGAMTGFLVAGFLVAAIGAGLGLLLCC